MEDMKKVDQKQKQLVHEDSKKKERHIVTWTQEEDDILRTQIGTHGTENWAIIASKFNDKTTRQCRRRWYTYLNSDFKKGGWSPEEDMLLCEAQKIFGNRWTEIAKVVSGRTDNAVKNRFNTLCKKRAKYEALAKENNTSYTNSNNKRIIFRDAASESAVDFKKMRRSHIPDDAEKINYADRSHKQNETPINSQQSRAPLAVLAQNSHNVNSLPDQHHVCNLKFGGYAQNKIQGTFLKKDDPKINALMQQAELLTSLALKVDAENMDQSLENAWKILQDFLNRNKESDTPGYKIPDLQLVDLQDLLEDLKNSSEEMQPCWRYMDLYEDSPGSSEHSTGSTSLPHSAGENLENSLHQDSGTELNSILHHSVGDNLENSQHQDCGTELDSILPHSAGENLENSLHQDCGTEMNSIQIGDQKGVGGCGQLVLSSATLDQDIFSSCDEQINNDGIVSSLSSTVFNSPLQVTPMFRSLAAGIPSPQFSESERNFLMKTLGMESPSLNPIANPSQPPTCKRALLQT